MVKEKQDWKDTLRTEKQKRDRSNDRDNSSEQIKTIENKKRATIMYRRRKLDKDVREYTKENTKINSRDIDGIEKSRISLWMNTTGKELSGMRKCLNIS